MLPSHWWWDLTTAQFEALDMSEIVAIQPIAAVEQHGPHLPVSVDATINAGIVARAVALLAPEAPVLVLPAMNVGKSNEHLAYPGTLSLDWSALGKAWFDLGKSVRRAGGRKILFFNSHGGQIQLLDIICRDLRVELDMFAVASSWFSMVDISDLFDETERAHGIHGGAIETSMMLHLAPEKVDMSLAGDFRSASIAIAEGNAVLRSEGSVGFGWQTQDLHPSGACGDASAASAEKGKAIIERAAEALATLALETAGHPLAALRSRPGYPAV